MKQKGFTLIELLVVVAIIGILAAVGMVAYNGYTSAAKKNVVKTQHNLTIKYIKTEIQKCHMGEIEAMEGNLKCSEIYINDKIADAVVKTFDKKYLNPYKSWPENSVAKNGPHGEGTSDPGNCQTFNYGGIMVSNVKSGSSTLVRVSTCHGEPTAIYEEFIIE